MSNFKKMVEARIARTGESWSTAAGRVRAQADMIRATPPPPDELARLLAQLHAPTTFRVLTGRVPATGGSASQAIAQEQSLRLMNNPLWYAETGSIQTTVTREQHELLERHGAANDTALQMLRTFPDNTLVGYSDQCRRCHRWIWCGGDEVEDTCFCGQKYRVALDLAEVEQGSMREGAFCMDCHFRRHPATSGTEPP